jgi:transcriptional regulator with XRE-family HTH domain
MSQLELSTQADVSTRHLSFVETGRSTPSRDMVLHLSETLDVPLRERNQLLLAAGYAPAFRETPLDSPSLASVFEAVRQMLAAHEPFPAAVLDTGWNLVEANAGLALFTAGVAPALLEPPVNVLRVSLHPAGLAPRIANLAQWRGHLLGRLRRQVAMTGGPRDLLDELVGYPGGEHVPPAVGIAVPLRLTTVDGAELAFLSTVTTFGTPLDVTVDELTIETFLPADAHTAEVLRSPSRGAIPGSR